MLKWIIYLAVVCSVFAADAFSTKAERGDAERDVQTGDDLLEGILTTSVVARSDGTDETKTLENVQTASTCTSISGWTDSLCAGRCSSAAQCHVRCARRCSTGCPCNGGPPLTDMPTSQPTSQTTSQPSSQPSFQPSLTPTVSATDLTVCTRESPMCVVTAPSDVGQSGTSSCSTCEFANPLGTGSAGNELFTGGSSCMNGRGICTCKFNGKNSLRRVDFPGDPGECAAECEREAKCNYAFYRRMNGACYLMPECSLTEANVGNNANSQGGVTYRKWQRPLMIDAGENTWPWFGDYTQTNWTEASLQPAAWSTVGTKPGFDWSLPPTVTQSPRASPIIGRVTSFGSIQSRMDQLEDYTASDHRITPTFVFWVKWRDVEVVQGQYDWSKLIDAVDIAVSRGWRVGVRLLTGREEKFAPAWMIGLGIKKKYENDTNSYDPSDPKFHELYLNLVASFGATGICKNPNVVSSYVGYVSPSNGDEHIGPKDDTQEDYDQDTDTVKARLDAWAEICPVDKIVMGGGSKYGFSLGMGYRGGFVENYYYKIPSEILGQMWTPEQEYLTVDESVPLIANRAVNGDENEEYERGWSSEYKTCTNATTKGGEKATNDCETDADCVAMQADNPRNSKIEATCVEWGLKSRFGPIAGFPYRYFMSMVRSTQMHLTYNLLNQWTLNKELALWSIMSMGRIASDSADAFSFLMQAEFHGGTFNRSPENGGPYSYKKGSLKNMERWLYQRDTAEIVTFKEAKVSQTPAAPCFTSKSSANAEKQSSTAGKVCAGQWMSSEPYDWIARAAPGGVIGFSIDREFAGTYPSMGNVVIKVSYFDYVGVGTLGVSTDGCRTTISTQPTSEDHTLKTATFTVATLPLSKTGALTDFDFEVCGFDANGKLQEIIVSFVRVIKADPPVSDKIVVSPSIA